MQVGFTLADEVEDLPNGARGHRKLGFPSRRCSGLCLAHLCVSASPGADCFSSSLGEKREVWLSGQEETLLARTTGMAGVSLATLFYRSPQTRPRIPSALQRLTGLCAGGADSGTQDSAFTDGNRLAACEASCFQVFP